jgi:RecJ-like exonuclease
MSTRRLTAVSSKCLSCNGKGWIFDETIRKIWQGYNVNDTADCKRRSKEVREYLADNPDSSEEYECSACSGTGMMEYSPDVYELYRRVIRLERRLKELEG